MKLTGLTRDSGLFSEVGDLQIIRFSDAADINLETLAASDGIILDASDPGTALDILARIRSSDTVDIYLKPVFLCAPEEVKDEYLLALADGTAELPMRETVSSPKLSAIIRKIQEKAKRLEPLRQESHEITSAVRLLRFLFTRGSVLSPVLSAASRNGFTYPLLAVCFRKEEEHRMFDVLRFAEREGLVEGEFIDKVNLCGKCQSTFLNFREVCRCGSSNLKLEDLYHHFTCAYVGPESDFGHTGALVCPKCRRQLKHIGVDYDKPSVLYTCNKCLETFQEPDVKAFCFSCSNDTSVEHLLSREIKRYTLTAKGGHAAIFGAKITMRDVITFGGLIDSQVFRAILFYEIERMKRVKREGCIAYLQFGNFQDLYLYGASKDKIFAEIIELIRDSIRPSDVLSYLDESTLIFFFPDTSAESVKIPVERLQNNLRKLIHDNFESFSPEIQTDVAAIHPGLVLDDFLNNIRPL